MARRLQLNKMLPWEARESWAPRAFCGSAVYRCSESGVYHQSAEGLWNMSLAWGIPSLEAWTAVWGKYRTGT